MKFRILFYFSLLALIVVIGCNKEGSQLTERPNLPEVVADYKIATTEANANTVLPSKLTIENFGEIDLNDCCFSNKAETHVEIENEVATLGRVLFYDQRLSINNRTSCGTCHKQALAFADGKQISQGFLDEDTPRNSMALVNPIYNNTFFWDSRASSLEDLVAQPIQNHIEMGFEDLNQLVEKISAQDFYPELFQKAYGSDEISWNGIETALTQFVASIYSTDSKFDRGIYQDFRNFSAQEKIGMALFFNNKTQCGSCHTGVNFASQDGPSGAYRFSGGTTNVGLEMEYKDQGSGQGRFKIPSLRNISLTAPYMHDGRFQTLRDVLNHYNEGIESHPSLDHKLRNPSNIAEAKRLNLSDIELDALEAFLHTLTSVDMLEADKFSNPFTE